MNNFPHARPVRQHEAPTEVSRGGAGEGRASANEPPVIGPERIECCPHCGAPDLFREEVHTGVGTMKGPASCENCGWAEPGIDADFDDDDDWILDPDMEDQ